MTGPGPPKNNVFQVHHKVVIVRDQSYSFGVSSHKVTVTTGSRDFWLVLSCCAHPRQKKISKIGICWQKDIVSNDSSRDAFRSVPNASLKVVRCVNIQPTKKIGQFQKLITPQFPAGFFWLASTELGKNWPKAQFCCRLGVITNRT